MCMISPQKIRGPQFMSLTCFCLSWLSSDTGLGTCLQQFKCLLVSTKYKYTLKYNYLLASMKYIYMIFASSNTCKYHVVLKYWNIWIANHILLLIRKLSQTHITFSYCTQLKPCCAPACNHFAMFTPNMYAILSLGHTMISLWVW